MFVDEKGMMFLFLFLFFLTLQSTDSKGLHIHHKTTSLVKLCSLFQQSRSSTLEWYSRSLLLQTLVVCFSSCMEWKNMWVRTIDDVLCLFLSLFLFIKNNNTYQQQILRSFLFHLNLFTELASQGNLKFIFVYVLFGGVIIYGASMFLRYLKEYYEFNTLHSTP